MALPIKPAPDPEVEKKMQAPNYEKLELLLSKAESYSRFLFSKRHDQEPKEGKQKSSPNAKRRRSVDADEKQ